ncbi:MAG: hypothetical protein ACYCYE_06090 [Clostridia bacterium]|nr:hypothetical protein [Peptococcaceae bacterium]
MRDLEKLIDEVNGSMSMEGMPLTKADKDRIRRCAGNDELVEEAIAELIKKHKAVKTHSSELQINK